MPVEGAAERAAIVAEWKKVSAEWKPKDYYGVGCVCLLAGAVIFLGLPKLVSMFPLLLPVWLKGLVALAAVVLALGGFILMGSRKLQASPADLATRAAEALASGRQDADAKRTSAVTILFHAYDFRGPTMSSNFDPAVLRGKLGSALDYVMDVERVLIEELKVYPVFTAPSS